MDINSNMPVSPEDPQLRETINEWAREVAEQGASFDIENISTVGENNLDFLRGGAFSEYFQHKVDVEKKRIEVLKRFNTFSEKSKEEADPKSLASKIFDGKAKAVYSTYSGGGISYPIRGQSVPSNTQQQSAPFSQTPSDMSPIARSTYFAQTSNSQGTNNSGFNTYTPLCSNDDEPVFGKPIHQNRSMDSARQESIPVFGKPLPEPHHTPVFGKPLPQSLDSASERLFPTHGHNTVSAIFGKQLPQFTSERSFPQPGHNQVSAVFGKELPQSTKERSFPTSGHTPVSAYKWELPNPTGNNLPAFGVDPNTFVEHHSTTDHSSASTKYLPDKLVDCYGEVILVMNQSGVIQLEEVQRPVLCYFKMSSLVGITKITEGIECRVNAKLISANQRISQVPYFAASVWLDGDKVPPEILTKLMVPVGDDSLLEYNYVVKTIGSKLPGYIDSQKQVNCEFQEVNERTTHGTKHIDNSRFDEAQSQDKLDNFRPKLSRRRSLSRENNRRGRRSRSRSSRNSSIKQEKRSPRANKRSPHRSVSRDKSRKIKRPTSRSRQNKSRSRSIQNKSRSRSRGRHSQKKPRPRSNSKDRKLKFHQRQISKRISNIQKKDEGKSKESKEKKNERKGKNDQVGLIAKKTPGAEVFNKAIQSVEKNSKSSDNYSNYLYNEQRNIHQGLGIFDNQDQPGQSRFNGTTPQFRNSSLPNNPADNFGQFQAQHLTANKDVQDQEQSPFRVLVAIDAVVIKFGFSKYFLNIGGSATLDNNEMPFFGSVIPPFIKNHDAYSDRVKKELMEKFNLKVKSDIEFQHPGKGTVKSTSEKECLENMIDYLETVALESNEQCVMVLHNIDCILPLLLRKLQFYKLETRFSGFVYGVTDVTSLAWNFATASQGKQYPSIRDLLNLLPNNCFYDEDPFFQSDDFATMIGKYIEKVILLYPQLGNQDSLFNHAALVNLEAFQKENKQIIAQIRCTDPARDKGKFVSQVEVFQGSGKQGSSRTLTIDLTTSKSTAQPSFEEEGHMAIALCESQIEPDKEIPVTLKLQVFVPEGLVLVLRNPENTSTYSMLPQAVSITNSSVMTKGVKEIISSVIVKVRNYGEEVLKINKGDELGLIRIKKEISQESAKSSQVHTTTESTEDDISTHHKPVCKSSVKTSHDRDLLIQTNSSEESGTRERENVEEEIKFVDGK